MQIYVDVDVRVATNVPGRVDVDVDVPGYVGLVAAWLGGCMAGWVGVWVGRRVA